MRRVTSGVGGDVGGPEDCCGGGVERCTMFAVVATQ